LWHRVSLYNQADLNYSPPICASQNSWGTGMYSAMGWNRVPLTFCLDSPQTIILPISASQVIRIKGMSPKFCGIRAPPL
jgi:hypothetical protein